MVVHIPNPRQKKYLWLTNINPGRLHVRGKEGRSSPTPKAVKIL
jgi:hypothetical protein